MPRLKKGAKLSRPKRRTKASKAKQQAGSDHLCSDHLYAKTASTSLQKFPTSSSQILSPSSLHKSETSLQDSCTNVENFDNCVCIFHEDDTAETDVQQPQTFDSDGFNADEYFLIVGTSYMRYDPSDDINHVTLQLLKQDVIKHEHVITNLKLNFLRSSEKLQLVKFYEKESVKVELTVTVDNNLTPLITVHGKHVSLNHPVYQNLTKVNCFNDLNVLLCALQSYAVCYGNPDAEYIEQFGFKGKAYLEGDFGASYNATIRSDSCSLLTLGLRCSECIATRGVLNSKKNRLKRKSSNGADSQNILSSTKPHSAMSRAELETKLKYMRAKMKSLELQNKRLQIRLELAKDKYKAVSDEDADDFQDLVSETTSDVEKIFPDPDSFQRIFWDEQVKYNKLKEKKAMRWHPLIVKWALYMKSKSSKAYEAMRTSGFINLPSERTLYSYSHCLSSELGFQPDALDLLATECKHRDMLNDSKPWKGYVGILQDEVKVKDDLVYCATTNRLIGYTQLDDVSDQMQEFERNFNTSESELATSALVVMVRGACTNLKFPLAAFGTKGLTAQQLDNVLWRAIELLELDAGLKVLFVTCDGAGQNRNFFERQRTVNCATGEPVNCIPNRYADDRNIYFISDVPHLLKTARNCFANSASHKKSRHMWKGGKDILWTQIVRLYREHHENNLYTKSKLTRAHIDLTSFSLMKVNLAAQVFSNRVAAELEEKYGEEVKETVTFVRHMNKFFDCCNTRNLYEGKEKRNTDLDPFTDPDDPRLDYLLRTFLGFFDEWSESVKQRNGKFTKDVRAKMQLSQQTLSGLKISVRSIVACVKFLLQEGAPFVLTAVFNQDILEQHFGHYRHKGGAWDNPSLDSIRHSMNVLRTVGSAAVASVRGNTKRMKLSPEDKDSLINHPLPRKR